MDAITIHKEAAQQMSNDMISTISKAGTVKELNDNYYDHFSNDHHLEQRKDGIYTVSNTDAKDFTKVGDTLDEVKKEQSLSLINDPEKMMDLKIKFDAVAVNRAKAATEAAAQKSTAKYQGVMGNVAKQNADTREATGGITLPEIRRNFEIEAARKHITGMSPDDIRKKTQQFSATGRENASFDPLLAAKVKLANQRKYGEDQDFAGIANPPVDETPDISARFSSDPSMNGQRLGKETPQGVEVLDASGQIVGHYN